MDNRLIYLLLLLCMTSCAKDDFTHEEKGSATLKLTLGLRSQGESTRAISNELRDGGVIENDRLAVYLMDATSGECVATPSQIEYNTGYTEAYVTFNNLKVGNYALMAIANYNDADEYPTDTPPTKEELEQKILNIGDGNQCDKDIFYPLTLNKNITIAPGVNQVEGELIRSFARVQVSVRNQSAGKKIAIEDFSFPYNITCGTTPLFKRENVQQANVKPVTTHENALKPFQSTIFEPITNTNGVMEVHQEVIYDGYMFESYASGYSCNLTISYEGNKFEGVVYVANSTPTTTIENNGLYLIKAGNGYLYNNNGTLAVGTDYTEGDYIKAEYVWRFEVSTGRNYYIMNMGTEGRYIYINNNNISLSTNKSSFAYESNSYLKASSRYIYISGNRVTSNRTQRTAFQLFKVDARDASSVQEVTNQYTIPFNIVNEQTGHTQPLTRIDRNDFIKLMITLSYNEKSGTVTFEVSDWQSAGGSTTFD